MKTIDDAVNELKCPIIDLHNMIGFRAAFKKGVEFAQKWTLFKDELPPLNTHILMKHRNTGYASIYFNSIDLIDRLMFSYTQWRLIELE